jgi:ankyrin repeat protein
MAQPRPAIHEAVRNLDVDALRRELAAGANVNALDESGKTPLYVACQSTPTWPTVRVTPPTWKRKVREREAIVAALLRAGANVNARYANPAAGFSDVTPLKAAVADRRCPPSDIVAQLIAAGSDIEAADDSGFFPLYTAAQHGRGATVSRLLAAGADPHRKLGSAGPTALEGATLLHNVRAYAPLLRAGVALPPANYHNAYLKKIAATPGGFPAYEREHRRRLTAVFTNKFPALPVEVISHIVLLWGHCGDYLY